MKRILYASGSVLTSDSVADAVVGYATALARAGSADSVRIPVLKDGQAGVVEFLIGPSSELIVEDGGHDLEGSFDDPSFLADITARRTAFEHPPVITATKAPNEDLTDLDEI